MTRQQLKKLVDEMSFKSHGLFLAYFIKGVLKNTELTLMQDSTLNGITTGGDYSPSSFDVLYKSCLEVLGLISEGKIDSVLTVLKRCPITETNKAILYFIDGSRCSLCDYFDADNIKGSRSIKGTNVSKEGYEVMSEETYQKTSFAGTRMGDILGVELFGAGNEANVSRKKKRINNG